MPAVVPAPTRSRPSGAFERVEGAPAPSPSAPDAASAAPAGTSVAIEDPPTVALADVAPPPATPSVQALEALDEGWDVAWSDEPERPTVGAAPAPSAASEAESDLSSTVLLPPKEPAPAPVAAAPADDVDPPTKIRESTEVEPPTRPRESATAEPAPRDEAEAAHGKDVADVSSADPADVAEAPVSEPSDAEETVDVGPAPTVDTERNQAFGDTFVDEPIELPSAARAPVESSLGDTVVDPPRALLGLEDVAGLTPPPPPPADLIAELGTEEYRPGDVIAGKYKLTCIIGRGGMGAVWLAHNLTLDIDVAIKLIRRDRAAPEAAARLLTEARAAARLGHASIVRVFDFGLAPAGDPYIVMEVLHGESLAAVLARKKRISPDVAVRTLLPVVSALVEAHDKGVVHRDLKPDNILLAMDERSRLVPKLVDFGIAKLIRTDVERAFTLAGEVLGSPDYMSPEQAKGEGVIGPATDIWALCIVLYELVTGKRPFEGPNYNALIVSIITNPPHPMTDHGIDDPALWAVIQRGLAKDISERWPSMSELGRALAVWATDRGLVEDVAGTAIAPHWLIQSKRSFSVYPPSSTADVIARHAPKPVAGQAPKASPAPRPAVETMVRPPFQPDRTPWMLGMMLVLGGLLAAFLTWKALAPDAPAATPPAPSAEAAPTAQPAATPEAAAVSPTAAAPSAPASPSASASADKPAKAPFRKPTGKPAAPPVPKGISF